MLPPDYESAHWFLKREFQLNISHLFLLPLKHIKKVHYWAKLCIFVQNNAQPASIIIQRDMRTFT